MKTYERLCQRNYTITDQQNMSFTIERGVVYTTSGEKDGAVIVFSRYWVSVPLDIFIVSEEPSPRLPRQDSGALGVRL